MENIAHSYRERESTYLLCIYLNCFTPTIWRCECIVIVQYHLLGGFAANSQEEYKTISNLSAHAVILTNNDLIDRKRKKKNQNHSHTHSIILHISSTLSILILQINSKPTRGNSDISLWVREHLHFYPVWENMLYQYKWNTISSSTSIELGVGNMHKLGLLFTGYIYIFFLDKNFSWLRNDTRIEIWVDALDRYIKVNFNVIVKTKEHIIL